MQRTELNAGPGEAAPAVELREIGLVRGGRALLAGVSWTVPRGGCCALLGPNGAGKSTLLAVVEGYLWPTSGQVTVLGERYGAVDLRQLRARMGLLGHSRMPRFHAGLSALETVLTGRLGATVPPPHWRPGPADLAAARRELDAAGLAGRESDPFGLLSSGEQMRVLLARVLAAEPELLILDEPTNSLDMAARAGFVATLERLKAARPDLTILLVTHHVEDLPACTTSALLLREGRVTASGPAASTLTSAALSAAFAHPLDLTRTTSGRWSARVVA